MKLKYKYLGLFISLLIIEIYIGLYIHDNIIRPYIGDVLVVGVIYFLLRGINCKSKFLALYVFIFACLVEIGQYFNLASVLHIDNFKLAKVILGSTFDLKDILCYFMGTIIIFIYERIQRF
ncbi:MULTISPECIES: DUF2809 domain-containing protein [unclassified Clostridium]|uniref:ribosomal maturation YjgA family protein n=1 Tax=unclassified Clostridium TaxID=2614128 RepID=UPI0002977BF1|nr:MULTISPECIES: DUF2809 domain-containing protein [unclassified Clostridium]EKQ57677.1 MAG: Protein of unknown function (DUF2809) [Clostridium sp. Maddingley MBC34-26]